jgi:hypothetical protein
MQVIGICDVLPDRPGLIARSEKYTTLVLVASKHAPATTRFNESWVTRPHELRVIESESQYPGRGLAAAAPPYPKIPSTVLKSCTNWVGSFVMRML